MCRFRLPTTYALIGLDFALIGKTYSTVLFGKENGGDHLKSIDRRPFQDGNMVDRIEDRVSNGRVKCYNCNGYRPHSKGTAISPSDSMNSETSKDMIVIDASSGNRWIRMKNTLLFLTAFQFGLFLGLEGRDKTTLFDEDVVELPV
ncbi:hypothetical protein Tco_0566071 [Tanacetum coccineum]